MKLTPAIEYIPATMRLTRQVQCQVTVASILFLNPEKSGQADVHSNFLNPFFLRPSLNTTAACFAGILSNSIKQINFYHD